MNLNQITIASQDVEAATEFYKLLGLELIVNALPRYVRFECPDGEATFSINKVKESQGNASITIYFENDNLDDLVKSLKEKGIKFLTDPEDKAYLWREATLLDLDGNKIILYHAGKNRKKPPWRI